MSVKSSCSTVLSSILWIIPAFALIHSLWFTWNFQTSEAFGDFWIWVDQFQLWKAGRFTALDLIAPLNEHRIAVSRLTFLVDSLFDKMNGVIPSGMTIFSLAATGLMLSRMAAFNGRSERPPVMPALFWIAWMMSTCQVDTLQFPLNVHFAVLLALATASTYLLSTGTAASVRLASIRAFCASLMFLAAVFTLAGGLLLAPVHVFVLVARRSRWQAFAAWLPLAALGISTLFWPHGPLITSHSAQQHYGLLARLWFVANFLASSLNEFPSAAPSIGLMSLIAYAGLGCGVLYRLIRSQGAQEEAALFGLASFVFLCGAAGTLTGRMDLGPSASLATRYASLSLLGLACLYILARKWLDGRPTPAIVRSLVIGAPYLALCFFNLPIYTRDARASSNDIKNNVDLMANNVGVEGPMFIFFGPKTLELGRQVEFLYKNGLNMFSSKFRPPAQALQAILHAKSAQPCLGGVDFAYSIDDHTLLAEGWLAWSKKRLVSWVVARDGKAISGAARPLAPRPDIGAGLDPGTFALGFKAGFRFLESGGDERELHLFGIDSANSRRICELTQQVLVGPIFIAPIQFGGALESAREVTMTPNTALDPSYNVAFLPPSLLNVPFWTIRTGQIVELKVTVSGRSIPAGDDLIIPFSGSGSGRDHTLFARFADGATTSAALRWPWDKPQILSAVIPQALLARHPGPLSIVIKVGGDGPEWMIGHPLVGRFDHDWSRLF